VRTILTTITVMIDWFWLLLMTVASGIIILVHQSPLSSYQKVYLTAIWPRHHCYGGRLTLCNRMVTHSESKKVDTIF